ncbi:MAG: GIY-YIG nuclease family protein [Verrucomicrobiia bacterium]
MKFSYTYVLLCADGLFYIGSTDNLKRRLAQHQNGQVSSTAYKRPCQLVYYEACCSVELALKRERELKTGYGRAYLKRRLCEVTPARNASRSDAGGGSEPCIAHFRSNRDEEL